uniref:Putative ovule protein n=1 Tax=Solanum chacoense TaxID=4108 RepID=A0A0V0IJC5_SOLCH
MICQIQQQPSLFFVYLCFQGLATQSSLHISFLAPLIFHRWCPGLRQSFCQRKELPVGDQIHVGRLVLEEQTSLSQTLHH